MAHPKSHASPAQSCHRLDYRDRTKGRLDTSTHITAPTACATNKDIERCEGIALADASELAFENRKIPLPLPKKALIREYTKL